jgi:hypothetical protein
MEHAEAVAASTTERYLLNELVDAERDAFEAHFFDCAICAEDVRDGARLMAAGRRVARQLDENEQRAAAASVVSIADHRSWTSWLPQAAAAVLLVGVIAWQNAVTIPELRRDRVAFPTQHQFTTGESRSTGAPAATAATIHAGEPALLWVEIPPREVARYRLDIRNSAGKSLSSRDVTLDESIEPIPLVIGALPTGSYVVVVEGVDAESKRSEITRHAFEVVDGQ